MARAAIASLLVAAATALASSGAPAAAGTPADLAPPPQLGATMVPAGWPDPPGVTADAYVLADLDSGQVLAALAADDPRPVASTVKILTSLSVLRRVPLDRAVTAGPEVALSEPGAAGVGLTAGETWTVEDLLEGVVARSGNDAARALAVAVGGSMDGFLELMRADAASLGLTGIELHTPDGLDDRNRLSARHLLELTRVAMEEATFAAIAARPVVELPDLGPVASRNDLLGEYPGAIGVKTGYTSASGRCLVAAAVRGQRRLVAVVLASDDADDHFADARALLDFGFDALDATEVAHDGPEVELLVPGGAVTLDAPAAVAHAPTGTTVHVTADVPAEADAQVVTLTASWDDEELVSVEAVAGAPPASAPHIAAPPPGGEGVGWWLVDRAYAALRAAGTAASWPATERT